MRTPLRPSLRSAATAAIITACLVFHSFAMANNGGCSTHSLRGSYVVSITGFIPSAPPEFAINAYSPVAVTGMFSFDGKGNVLRSLLVNFGGLPFPVADSGSYQVNPDCSGSARFSTNSEMFNFVPIDQSTLAIVSATPGETGGGTLAKQIATRCTDDALEGVYVFNGSGLGTFQTPPQTTDAFFPVAVSGTWAFDGKGNVTRALSLNFAGLPGPYDDTGTYQVDADCSASAYFPSDSEGFQLLVVDPKTIAFGVNTVGRLGAGVLLKAQEGD